MPLPTLPQSLTVPHNKCQSTLACLTFSLSQQYRSPLACKRNHFLCHFQNEINTQLSLNSFSFTPTKVTVTQTVGAKIYTLALQCMSLPGFLSLALLFIMQATKIWMGAQKQFSAEFFPTHGHGYQATLEAHILTNYKSVYSKSYFEEMKLMKFGGQNKVHIWGHKKSPAITHTNPTWHLEISDMGLLYHTQLAPLKKLRGS